MGYIRSHPNVVKQLLEDIDKSPTGDILVKIEDMKKAMGPYFEAKTDISIYWGMKYAFFQYGILASHTLDKERHALYRLRRKYSKGVE